MDGAARFVVKATEKQGGTNQDMEAFNFPARQESPMPMFLFMLWVTSREKVHHMMHTVLSETCESVWTILES